MANASILFAYGASGGSAAEHGALIAKWTGSPPQTLHWRDRNAKFSVPNDMEGYMKGRMADMPVDLQDPLGAGKLGPIDWAWENLRPSWRRSALRGVYGRVADGYMTMADALNYLHNGILHVAAARPIIEEWAATAPPPRVAIGLSLGGLILADTLAEIGRDGKTVPVELLVTVGSQAGVINKSDAMAVLRRIHGEGPKAFEPWLNIWNKDDYLSWPVEGSIPDSERIRDALVETPDLSFPESHSAYFDLETTYVHIGNALGQSVLKS